MWTMCWAASRGNSGDAFGLRAWGRKCRQHPHTEAESKRLRACGRRNPWPNHCTDANINPAPFTSLGDGGGVRGAKPPAVDGHLVAAPAAGVASGEDEQPQCGGSREQADGSYPATPIFEWEERIRKGERGSGKRNILTIWKLRVEKRKMEKWRRLQNGESEESYWWDP